MSDISGTAAAEALYGTTGDDTIVGNGGGDHLYGGRGNDVLTGGEDGTDWLIGESGNDTLYGGGGNDNLYGDAGDDLVHGGDGDDFILSDEVGGSDTVYGDAGDDSISITRIGGFGAIQAFGGTGGDFFDIDVRSGATIVADGGEGDDYFDIFTWSAAATLTLGAGRDLLRLDSFSSSTGTATGIVVTDFQTGAGGDVLFLAETLVDWTGKWDGVSSPFSAGFFRLSQSGADAILEISAAANGIFTKAFVFKNVDASTFTAENFGGLPLAGQVSTGLLLSGTDAIDVLGGGAGDDTIDGGAGRDRIIGGFGSDTLSGGDGNDTIWGGAGNDSVSGGEGRDVLYGGFGDDVLHGGGGDDTLYDNDSGTDALYGEDGNDSINIQRDSLRAGGSTSAYGGAGDDLLTITTSSLDPIFVDGGTGDDRLRVRSHSGTLTATLGDGHDVVDLTQWTRATTSTATITITDFAAGDGGDRLDWFTFLTSNAPTYVPGANPFATGFARLVQSGADVLLQFDRDGPGTASGYATLMTFQNVTLGALTAFNFGGFAPDGSTPAAHAIAGTDAAETLFGTGGADNVDGAGGNDVLYGTAAAETLSGGDGDDIVHGGAGNDTIDGGLGNDSLYGEQGTDTLSGGAGNDNLTDDVGGSDTLSGGDGDDSLYVARSTGTDAVTLLGGDGNDGIVVNLRAGTATVDAGAGDDIVGFDANTATTLTLGAGSDTIFVYYLTASALGTITITDFQAGDGGDHFDWDHFLTSQLTNFLHPFAQDQNPFTAGYMKLVKSGADTVLQIDTSGAGSGYVNWITFKNTDIWSLTAWNFDGYATPYTMVHGTPADETFSGGTGNDGFDGGGGNDTFLIGYGGDDYALGGAGDDTFFVALTSAAASHRVTGAGGADLLQLQGHGTQAVTIGTSAAAGTLIDATGIETVQLLASADAKLGRGRRRGLHIDAAGRGDDRRLDAHHRRERPGERRQPHLHDRREGRGAAHHRRRRQRRAARRRARRRDRRRRGQRQALLDGRQRPAGRRRRQR